MRILIAPDSFKGSLSAPEAADAMAAGVTRACPDAEIDRAPLADGGEGTTEALVAAAGGEYAVLTVTGPLGDPVEGRYGLIDGGRTAVIEMAAAAGYALVPPDQRDPRHTTTRGVGELIRHALDNGATQIILGLGGSATNDAGAGMAQALGYRLLDAEGHDLPPGGAALARLDSIDPSQRHPRLADCQARAACDVDNPLYGPKGASHVFGPQKGATPETAAELDKALAHFSRCVADQLGASVADVPGAGAAGGLGAGVLAFCGGRLEPGFGLVAEACNLAERIERADLVLTGEGALDGQTLGGKVPHGVARLAKERSTPVAALAGRLGGGYRDLYGAGLTAAFSIAPGPIGEEESMARTAEFLTDAAEAVAALWRGARAKENP